MGQSRTAALVLFLFSIQGATQAGNLQLSSRVQSGSLEFGGLKRTYLYYAPESGLKNCKTPLSLLLVLHGGGGKPDSLVKTTFGRFNELADRDKFIVVYPAGVDKQWNDGRDIPESRAHREKIDDVGFLSALIDLFQKKYGTDPKRVYVTGISNGAMMSSRLACELSDKIAVAAPVAGSIPTVLAKTCQPTYPISLLMINGDADPLVPFEGGQVHLGRMKRGEIIPVRDAALFWAKRNGCGIKPVAENLPDRDPKDGTTVEKLSYSNPKTGMEVALYILHGGGHTWPKGWKYAPEWLVGRVSQELDACDVIWDFCKAHPKK